MTEDLNNPEEKSVTVFSANTPMLFAPKLENRVKQELKKEETVSISHLL
jgi:hypothetical protein